MMQRRTSNNKNKIKPATELKQFSSVVVGLLLVLLLNCFEWGLWMSLFIVNRFMVHCSCRIDS